MDETKDETTAPGCHAQTFAPDGELPAFTELAALSDTGAPASYRPVRHETAATAAFAASLSGGACAATLTRACADWIACC